MFQISILAISLLASSAAAKLCVNVTIPVQISARQEVFNVPTLMGNLDATVFAQNLTSIRGNFSETSLTGYATITGDYKISAKFCKPDVMYGKTPTVESSPMALVFTRRKCDGDGTSQSQRALFKTLPRSTADVISIFSYWDLPYKNFNYSCIDVAVDKYGFCTLSIDRSGIGNSSIADPSQVIQAPVEMSALYEVTEMLRNGTIPNVPRAFKKVVHVGHSFGSVLTYNLVAQHPSASDGIILTGYSQDGAFFFQTIANFNSKLARLNQPLRFGNISSTVVQQGLSMFLYPELDSIKKYLSRNQITIAEVSIPCPIHRTRRPHYRHLPHQSSTNAKPPNQIFNLVRRSFQPICLLLSRLFRPKDT